MLKEELITELTHFMVEFESKVARPAELCAKSTVSGVQLQLLLVLHHYGALKMSDLAGHKKISKPQLTAAVNNLVKQELVERIPDENDRRIIRIRCSEKGSAYLQSLHSQMLSYLSKSVNTLTEREQQELRAALQTARKLIHKFHTTVE